MTENMAGRGEGLAGRIEEIVCRGKHKRGGPACQASCGIQVRMILAALEAAAPAGTAQPELLCVNCGHSYAQHTKGINHPQKYCRHCPCSEWAALATPSPQAPPATEFGPFTLTVGELLADGIFHRCVESGEFNHALCAKMIDNALAEEKLSNIAATQEPAGSGADIGKVGASIDFRFAGSGAQCTCYTEANEATNGPCPIHNAPDSPRKVGEDGAQVGDEVWIKSRVIAKHGVRGLLIRVDGVGEPIMLQTWVPIEHFDKLRPSSAPVGEQKQEEGV